MGRDKADLLLDGRPLLEWVLQAPRSADLPSDVLRRDRVEGLGPLGGVRTAFERYREDSLLFLACDSPFVDGVTLLRLLRAGANRHESVVHVRNGRPGFPFLLHRRALSTVEDQLARGERSLLRLFERLRPLVLYVPPQEEARFLNINTPGDLERARRLVADRRG